MNSPRSFHRYVHSKKNIYIKSSLYGGFCVQQGPDVCVFFFPWQTEQLSSTPVPLSYRRHASRFLSVWTLTAPLFLVPQCGPLLAIVSQATIFFFIFPQCGPLFALVSQATNYFFLGPQLICARRCMARRMRAR